VLAHARALLTGTPEGRTAYLDADLRDPDRILDSPELRETLDLTRPVALSLIAIFHFFPDEDDPYGIVRRLLEAVPPGSCLALSHFTPDYAPGEAERLTKIYQQQGISVRPRTRAEVVRFFDGLDLVDPGVQPLHRWRPDETVPTDLTDAQVSLHAGVAVKR
jgi:hypothetical protein